MRDWSSLQFAISQLRRCSVLKSSSVLVFCQNQPWLKRLPQAVGRASSAAPDALFIIVSRGRCLSFPAERTPEAQPLNRFFRSHGFVFS
jgi:hypothetical protein